MERNKNTGGNRHWCLSSCPNQNRQNINLINNAFSSASENSDSQTIISELEKKIQGLEIKIIDYKNQQIFKVNYN